MSWVTTAQEGSSNTSSVPMNLDEITDEEFLRHLWQQCDDYGERRRIRGRMYKLREKRLREMVQNDEESLGILSTTGKDSYAPEGRKSSNIEVKMLVKDDSAITDSVSMHNVRMGGITMRGVEPRTNEDDRIIEEQIREVSKGRGRRFELVKSKYDEQNAPKSAFSTQSEALSSVSYESMKHKEVRDSISPTRNRDDSDNLVTSEDEVATFKENQKTFETKESLTAKKSQKKNISNMSSATRTSDKTSTFQGRRIKNQTSSSSDASPTSSPTRMSKRGNRAQMSRSGRTQKAESESSKVSSKNDYNNKLDTYISSKMKLGDEIIMEEEEEGLDESGNVVKMIVQTIRNKDGTECTSRRIATSTKIVDNENDIDEILIGNPDHEVLERNVEEKEDRDGSKIKIITEKRRRPDGIEYATKNVLKTSKIFDYDHPEDVAYCDEDELVHSEESEEMDEQGISIKTVMETRRKSDGTEYMTKKVYKTFKIDSRITPSFDDEIVDSRESEEEQSDGTIVKTVIEKRRNKDGEIYTHRQIYRSRKLTLTGIDLQKGLPFVNNDDEVIDKKFTDEEGEDKSKVKVVTETRRRKDGSTYTFDYILRNLKVTEEEIKNMPMQTSNSSNIAVSLEDELIKEDIKEDLQKDGSTIKTIIERRRAKDGTQYLRHRIMKIPKLPEPKLQVGSLDDEVLEEEVKEKVLDDGTQCRAVTERRRSSVTGIQYTLRRMSKIFHPHQSHILEGRDEIVDENVAEEESSDGATIKTIIRRYERPNGTFYTTHDIQKSYQNPISVNIESYEEDELVDRAYDERESSDGFIVKTILETRCRTDGTHYTIERTERVSKESAEDQMSLKGNSISKGSPGDTIISCIEHEEPTEDGNTIKTILEVRQKSDGSRYSNKMTIKSTQLWTPEYETSYVVIKADDVEDEAGLMPSLDDDVIYTRKKKDVDELGNPITVVIETRQSKVTGEKYNLTKRVHTTDVVITSQGEKILTNKKSLTTNKEEKVPYGVVSALKNRFIPTETSESSTQNVAVNRTKTANKKKFFEDAAAKTMTPKLSNFRSLNTEENLPATNKKPTSANSKDVTIKKSKEAHQKKTSEEERNIVSKDKITESSSATKTKSTETAKRSRLNIDINRKSKSDSRSSDSSSSEQKSTKLRTTPLRKQKADISRKKSPTESKHEKESLVRVSSSSKKSRSSETTSSHEETPSGRISCNRAHGREDKNPSKVSPILKKRASNDRIKSTGEDRKLDTKRNIRSDMTQKTHDRRSNTIQNGRQAEKKPNGRLSPKKDVEKNSSKITSRQNSKKKKEPIVDIPQTPMTEDMKSYPMNGSPLIEDVTSQPNLPFHSIHRPSLVSEPTESPSSDDSTSAMKKVASSSVSNNMKSLDKKRSSKKITSRSSSSDIDVGVLQKKRLSKTLSNERVPKKGRDPLIKRGSGSEKETAKSSIFSQIIPDDKVDKFLNPVESKSPMTSNALPQSNQSSHLNSTATRTPITEPLIIPKYIHPMEDEDKADSTASRRSVSPLKFSSPLRQRSRNEEASDVITPLVDRSMSPFSKECSPRPRSKEGSPSPFHKEDSPSRFITGKAIDEGANICKIKRLERSNSNKKMIYEDLEDLSSKLPSYINDIEYITDLKVLETLLQKAETYEERRVIRGHIRNLKKSSSGMSQTSLSSTTSDRFIKPLTSQPKFSAPRKISTEEPIKKMKLKKDFHAPIERASMTDSLASKRSVNEDIIQNRNVSVSKRKTSKDEPLRRKFSDEKRKLSVEENKRKSSFEERKRKPSIEENKRKSSIEEYKRKSSVEENRRKLSIDKSSRKTSADESMSKSSSSDEQPRKNKSYNSRRPTEEFSIVTKRKQSTEEKTFKRKSSTEESIAVSKTTVNTKRYSRQASREEEKSEYSTIKKVTSKKSTDALPSKPEVHKQKITAITEKFTSSNLRKSDQRKKTKEAVDEPYVEPLRHQKAMNRISSQQTNVEKVVSPYGVGPTDENGVPLFGLKALKRKNKPQEIFPEVKTVEETPKSPEFEPTDSRGRNLFGLGALNKSPPEKSTFTATQVAKETASIQETRHRAIQSTEESHMEDSVVTKLTPFETEIVNVTNRESDASSDESREDDDLRLSDRRQKRMKRRIRRRSEEDFEDQKSSDKTSDSEFSATEQKSTGLEETSPALVRSVNDSLRRRRDSSSDTEEDHMSSKLKSMIKLHEKKAATDQSSPQPSKPRKVLRDTFQITNESKTHRTWNLETDLSTRSEDIGNIIAKHETLTHQEPGKPLTSILKKSSTTTPSDFEFEEPGRHDTERKMSYSEIKVSNYSSEKEGSVSKSMRKVQSATEEKTFSSMSKTILTETDTSETILKSRSKQIKHDNSSAAIKKQMSTRNRGPLNQNIDETIQLSTKAKCSKDHDINLSKQNVRKEFSKVSEGEFAKRKHKFEKKDDIDLYKESPIMPKQFRSPTSESKKTFAVVSSQKVLNIKTSDQHNFEIVNSDKKSSQVTTVKSVSDSLSRSKVQMKDSSLSTNKEIHDSAKGKSKYVKKDALDGQSQKKLNNQKSDNIKETAINEKRNVSNKKTTVFKTTAQITTVNKEERSCSRSPDRVKARKNTMENLKSPSLIRKQMRTSKPSIIENKSSDIAIQVKKIENKEKSSQSKKKEEALNPEIIIQKISTKRIHRKERSSSSSPDRTKNISSLSQPTKSKIMERTDEPLKSIDLVRKYVTKKTGELKVSHNAEISEKTKIDSVIESKVETKSYARNICSKLDKSSIKLISPSYKKKDIKDVEATLKSSSLVNKHSKEKKKADMKKEEKIVVEGSKEAERITKINKKNLYKDEKRVSRKSPEQERLKKAVVNEILERKTSDIIVNSTKNQIKLKMHESQSNQKVTCVEIPTHTTELIRRISAGKLKKDSIRKSSKKTQDSSIRNRKVKEATVDILFKKDQHQNKISIEIVSVGEGVNVNNKTEGKQIKLSTIKSSPDLIHKTSMTVTSESDNKFKIEEKFDFTNEKSSTFKNTKEIFEQKSKKSNMEIKDHSQISAKKIQKELTTKSSKEEENYNRKLKMDITRSSKSSSTLVTTELKNSSATPDISSKISPLNAKTQLETNSDIQKSKKQSKGSLQEKQVLAADNEKSMKQIKDSSKKRDSNVIPEIGNISAQECSTSREELLTASKCKSYSAESKIRTSNLLSESYSNDSLEAIDAQISHDEMNVNEQVESGKTKITKVTDKLQYEDIVSKVAISINIVSNAGAPELKTPSKTKVLTSNSKSDIDDPLTETKSSRMKGSIELKGNLLKTDNFSQECKTSNEKIVRKTKPTASKVIKRELFKEAVMDSVTVVKEAKSEDRKTIKMRDSDVSSTKQRKSEDIGKTKSRERKERRIADATEIQSSISKEEISVETSDIAKTAGRKISDSFEKSSKINSQKVSSISINEFEIDESKSSRLTESKLTVAEKRKTVGVTESKTLLVKDKTSPDIKDTFVAPKVKKFEKTAEAKSLSTKEEQTLVRDGKIATSLEENLIEETTETKALKKTETKTIKLKEAMDLDNTERITEFKDVSHLAMKQNKSKTPEEIIASVKNSKELGGDKARITENKTADSIKTTSPTNTRKIKEAEEIMNVDEKDVKIVDELEATSASTEKRKSTDTIKIKTRIAKDIKSVESTETKSSLKNEIEEINAVNTKVAKPQTVLEKKTKDTISSMEEKKISRAETNKDKTLDTKTQVTTAEIYVDTGKTDDLTTRAKKTLIKNEKKSIDTTENEEKPPGKVKLSITKDDKVLGIAIDSKSIDKKESKISSTKESESAESVNINISSTMDTKTHETKEEKAKKSIDASKTEALVINEHKSADEMEIKTMHARKKETLEALGTKTTFTDEKKATYIGETKNLVATKIKSSGTSEITTPRKKSIDPVKTKAIIRIDKKTIDLLETNGSSTKQEKKIVEIEEKKSPLIKDKKCEDTVELKQLSIKKKKSFDVEKAKSKDTIQSENIGSLATKKIKTTETTTELGRKDSQYTIKSDLHKSKEISTTEHSEIEMRNTGRKTSKECVESKKNYSKQQSTDSVDAISNNLQRRASDARTYSLSSITSSMPGYMRPKGDQRPERRSLREEKTQQEIEDLLLNSYQYTRCTKRVVKSPVHYDYTYVIKHNDPAAGSSDSYSIYFGPRESAPSSTMSRASSTRSILSETESKKGMKIQSHDYESGETIDRYDNRKREGSIAKRSTEHYDSETKEMATSRKESAQDSNAYLNIRQEYLDKVNAIPNSSLQTLNLENNRRGSLNNPATTHDVNSGTDKKRDNELKSNDILLPHNHPDREHHRLSADNISELQQKYCQQLEAQKTNIYQNFDSQDVQSYSKERPVQDNSKGLQICGNAKYLADYDYNKIYADQIEHSRKTSDHNTKHQQSSSTAGHYYQYDNESYSNEQSRKDKLSSQVTFDGRFTTSTSMDRGFETRREATESRNESHEEKKSSTTREETKSTSETDEARTRDFVGSSSMGDPRPSAFSVVSPGNDRSFLDDRSKVTGISDVLTRMSASPAVDHESKITSDEEARSLLNKFLGAQVLMTGVESMMTNTNQGSSSSMSMTRESSGQSKSSSTKDGRIIEQNSSSFSTGPQTISYSSNSPKVEECGDIVKGINICEVTDDFSLNQLLDSCEEYDERRRVRMRLKALMADKKALQKELIGHDFHSSSRKVAGVSGSRGLDSSEGSSSFSISRGSSQVSSQKSNFSTTQNMRTLPGKDGASALNKFKQMDASNPKQTSNKSGPLFQLSSSLNRSASGVKDMILIWCQCRTRDYKGVKIENFSTSWNDGLAFCALIHHFYPDAFDYDSLNAKKRRHNFSLAFRVADEKAGVMALLDVDDMVMMEKPDWKCVFTYVQSLYKRLKDE